MGYDDGRKKVDVEREDKAKLLKIQREGELADLRWLLSDPRGRRVADRVMCKTALLDVTETISAELHKREGKRLIGDWWIKELAQADHKQVVKMIGEKYEPGN